MILTAVLFILSASFARRDVASSLIRPSNINVRGILNNLALNLYGRRNQQTRCIQLQDLFQFGHRPAQDSECCSLDARRSVVVFRDVICDRVIPLKVPFMQAPSGPSCSRKCHRPTPDAVEEIGEGQRHSP